MAQRRVGGALGPHRRQPLRHRAVGALQHGQVGAALAVGVGVGVEAALGGDAGAAEFGHDLRLAEARGGGLQALGLGELLAELAEGPALDQAHGGQRLVAPHHLAEQLARRGAAGELVAARADAPGIARPAKPLIQQPGRLVDTGVHPGLGDVAWRGAQFDRQLHRVGAQVHGPVQPQPRHAGGGEREAGAQHQGGGQAGQPSAGEGRHRKAVTGRQTGRMRRPFGA
jgi:hypothetical protein